MAKDLHCKVMILQYAVSVISVVLTYIIMLIFSLKFEVNLNFDE